MNKGVKIALVCCVVAILAGAGFWIWSVENKKHEASAFAWPVKIADNEKLNISAVYGWRIHPLFNDKRFHYGIDIDLAKNREIVASMDGKVQLAEWNSGYGNCVVIKHDNGLKTLYGHLDKLLVKFDQTVKKGDLIGLAGSTGTATTVNLHFEIRKNINGIDVDDQSVNPEEMLPKIANIEHQTPKPASNKTNINQTTGFMCPFKKNLYSKVDLTPGFGNRIYPITNRAEFHTGVDICLPMNAEILAVGEGKVTIAKWHGGYGNFVEIDHGNGIKSRYGHMSELLVKAGDTVTIGQIIGLCGSTGYSVDPHLHFEIMKGKEFYDPKGFVNLR